MVRSILAVFPMLLILCHIQSKFRKAIRAFRRGLMVNMLVSLDQFRISSELDYHRVSHVLVLCHIQCRLRKAFRTLRRFGIVSKMSP